MDARYDPARAYQDDPAPPSGGRPVTADEKRWIDLLFSWCVYPFDPGNWFAQNLRDAVLAALRGDQATAEDRYARADEAHRLYIGYGAHYTGNLLGLARRIIDTRELPFEVEGWDCPEDQGPPGPILRPVKPEREMTAAQADTLAAFASSVSQIPIEEYAATRAAELAEVRAQLEAGTFPLSDAPELAAEALAAHAELDEEEAAQVAELEAKRAEVAGAQLRRDAAAARVAELQKAAAPNGLGGISDEFKRFRKRVSGALKRAPGDVIDPVKRAASELSHSILPSAVREFGYQMEQEASRLGRRVTAETIRAMGTITEQAPWIKAAAGLAGLLIPGIGMLVYLLALGALGGVEVAWAYRQKIEIKEQIRMALNALNADLYNLIEEAKALEALAAELEAQRLAFLEVVTEKREARIDIAGRIFEEQAGRERKALMLAAGAAGAGILLSKRPIVAAIPVVAFLGWAWRERTRGPLVTYRACLEAGYDEESCRAGWLAERGA